MKPMDLKWILVAAPLILGSLAGCVTGSAYSTLPVDEWRTAYENTPGAFLLDVRTPAEFQEGYIADATLIPYTELRARQDELPADLDTPIFIYCRTANRSAIASQTLIDLGYTEVYELAGGIVAWHAHGQPIEGGPE
jgi:rhodanese-related sulfurtransferase